MLATDFSAFYEEVHGVTAFPWQRDLVSEIIERGSWPTLVDVPTGLGKTTMIDIAVFLSALEADSTRPDKVGRRRIFFVVDRRIVVDQAARHAARLARSLATAPPGSVTAEVASRVRNMAGPSANDGILPTVTMRGGTTWEAAWLSRPDQPGIVTGTVDQVGSRLFFRGYGLSPRRRPIDAALVGTDSLILVDEAHLATALTTSLLAAATHDVPETGLQVPAATIVQLTATAPRSASGGWSPAFDVQAHLAHPVAAARIAAPKSLRIEHTSKAGATSALVSATDKEARAPGARVLVVCNTIDRAREVHSRLIRVQPETEVLLLIGRSRVHDREEIVDRAVSLFEPSRQASATAAVLVATQTVEVGIDLDATALVTECASWDALVQRIGRVNRRGLRSSGSVVVIQDDDPKPPVYGAARIRTAEFLSELTAGDGQRDVSPLALRVIQAPPDAISSSPLVPLLLPAHLNAWVRTSPAPVNDAPLDAYLHGIDRGVAPVSLAWRNGLLQPDGSRVTAEEANLTVESIPVRAEECVEVPIAAVRRWLVKQRAMPVSDWDNDDDWDVPFGEDSDVAVLRRTAQSNGTSSWEWVSASQLRPGDLVVIPTEVGGLDLYGWNPASTTEVLDVSELVALERGLPLLRLDSRLPRRLGLMEPDPNLWDLLHTWQVTDSPELRTEAAQSCRRLVVSWLENARSKDPGPWDRRERRRRLAEALSSATMREAHRTSSNDFDSSDSTHVLPVAVIRPERSKVQWLEATDDTAGGSAHVLRQVTLVQHGSAVATRADEICQALGLPAELCATVRDAARWHDWGKVDPRFQAMLFEGDPIRAAIAPEPLAKSGMAPGDLQQHRLARRRSKLPRGVRHESWSHALVAKYLETAPELRNGDTQLLLHLVASHHGHARPLLPPIPDSEHELEADLEGRHLTVVIPDAVDLSMAERFAELNQRYGRWGLALLETIVRCADMTVSGEGS